jgi:rSAM/selenodomain-associated transferase 2
LISIIIPTFNEEESIGELICYLKQCIDTNSAEIIVSDGGSLDHTYEIAKRAGANAVLSPEKGRSAQLNFGASFATGEVLYFVHADTYPPTTFISDIETAVDQGYQLGRYRTKFRSNKTLLAINAFFTRFDWFVCYGGDQTLFIVRELFDEIGGYRQELLIMEDYDIVTRGRQKGRYKIFSKAALVSARKYDTNSWLTVQLANRAVVKMYRRGASQTAIVKKYKEMLVYR